MSARRWQVNLESSESSWEDGGRTKSKEAERVGGLGRSHDERINMVQRIANRQGINGRTIRIQLVIDFAQILLNPAVRSRSRILLHCCDVEEEAK